MLFILSIGLFYINTSKYVSTVLRTTLVIISILFASSFIGYGVYYTNNPQVDYDYKFDYSRISFLFVRPQEYFDRLVIAFPVVALKPDNSKLLLGWGVGKYGQETMLNE